MADSLSRIVVRRVQLPLKVPYRLSFGPQHRFDCVIVEVTDTEGRCGWGEAALLPGYTEESGDDSWALAQSVADRIAGTSFDAAEQVLRDLPLSKAFTCCAFRTALEQLRGHPTLAASGTVEILGAVNEKPSDPALLEAEIESLISEGYGTLKVKVGFDVASDLEGVRLIQSMVAGRAKLRIDANQGYTRSEGVQFVASIDPTNVELIEQPCATCDWDAAVAVKQAAVAPIMLDESIYSLADIRRAAELECADYIKLKLMKMAGLDRLIEGLALIRDLGMKPVLGNGVATDLGCWMEAAVAVAHIDNAGEFNGFLRPVHGILSRPLERESSQVRLDGELRYPDPDRLQAHTVAQYCTGGA